METTDDLWRSVTALAATQGTDSDVAIRHLLAHYEADRIADVLAEHLDRELLPTSGCDAVMRLLACLRGRGASALAERLAAGQYPTCAPHFESVRRAIGLVLSAGAAQRLIPRLLKELAPPFHGSEYLIWAAGFHHVDGARPALQRMASGRVYVLRKHALLALGRLGHAEDIQCLEDEVGNAERHDGTESPAGFAAAGLGFAKAERSTGLLIERVDEDGPLAHVADRAVRMITGKDAGWSENDESVDRMEASARWRHLLESGDHPISEAFRIAVYAADPRIWLWRSIRGLARLRLETELGGPGPWLEWYRYLWFDHQRAFEIGSVCGTCRYWLDVCGVPQADMIALNSRISTSLETTRSLSAATFEHLWPLLQVLRPGKHLAAILPLTVHPVFYGGARTPLVSRAGVADNHPAIVQEPRWDHYWAGEFPLRTVVPGYPAGLVDVAVVPLQPVQHLDLQAVGRYMSETHEPGSMAVAVGQLELHLPLDSDALAPPRALLRLYLLDGHHKIHAAALSGRPCRVLSILPTDAIHTIVPGQSDRFAVETLTSILDSATVSL